MELWIISVVLIAALAALLIAGVWIALTLLGVGWVAMVLFTHSPAGVTAVTGVPTTLMPAGKIMRPLTVVSMRAINSSSKQPCSASGIVDSVSASTSSPGGAATEMV